MDLRFFRFGCLDLVDSAFVAVAYVTFKRKFGSRISTTDLLGSPSSSSLSCLLSELVLGRTPSPLSSSGRDVFIEILQHYRCPMAPSFAAACSRRHWRIPMLQQVVELHRRHR